MDIWTILGFSIGGVSVLGLLIGVAITIIKAKAEKIFSRKQLDKSAEYMADKTCEKIKKVTIRQEIQPVLESGLEKVNEKSVVFVKKAVDDLNAKLDQIIRIQEAQAKYFDNSIGVNEEARVELKQAIADAKNTPKIEETQEIEIVIDESNKDEKIDKKQAKIER